MFFFCKTDEKNTKNAKTEPKRQKKNTKDAENTQMTQKTRSLASWDRKWRDNPRNGPSAHGSAPKAPLKADGAPQRPVGPFGNRTRRTWRRPAGPGPVPCPGLPRQLLATPAAPEPEKCKVPGLPPEGRKDSHAKRPQTRKCMPLAVPGGRRGRRTRCLAVVQMSFNPNGRSLRNPGANHMHDKLVTRRATTVSTR